MVCPYSLSIPVVQAQVLGLARPIRRSGHEVVLALCDGPPPEPFVTPLGDSLPTAANGSVAPLALDPAAALRTLRVLRDEVFDVIHVHEPLAPGPSLTTVTLHVAPTVGTFHAAGRSTSYRLLAPLLRRLLDRIDERAVVSKDALASCSTTSGARRRLHRALQRRRDGRHPPPRRCRRHDRRSSSSAGTKSARVAVLLQAFRMLDLDVSCWVAGDGPDTDRLRIDHAGDTRIEWLGRVDEAEKLARLRGASVVCAFVARRVVRRRVDRGDGGRHARGRQLARRLPQCRHRRRRRPARRARQRTALAAALERAAREPALAEALVAKGSDRADDSMSRSPTSTWRSTPG